MIIWPQWRHIKPLCSLLNTILLILCSSLVAAAAEPKEQRPIEQNQVVQVAPVSQIKFSDTLSTEERNWLLEKKKIQIGVMNDWPPMSYIDNSGTVRGIGIDYLKAINKRLNGVLVPVPAPFKQNFDKVKAKQLAGIMDITPKPERMPFFEFTQPYMSIPHAIVGRKDGPYFDSEEDLNGRTVALEKGYYNVTFFQKKYPQVLIKQYSSTAEALEAVARSEADAYAGNRVVAMYLIEQELLFNLTVMGRMDKPPVKLNIGVRKDWPILARIIDRAIADISSDEARLIHKRWVDEIKKADKNLTLQLTKDEQAWLNNHATIRLGVDQEWPPVEWIDQQGRYQGVACDHIELITNMLGIQIAPVERLPWAEVLEKAKRKEIDLLPALVASPERSKFLNFTSPYLSFPFVVFTPDDSPLVTELRDLYGKVVAVEKGYVSYEFLQRDHPRIKLKTFETTENILKALSLGKIDAYVGNLTVASYLIKKSGYTNIKVAAPTPYNFDLSIGVRKDWPELVPILEKTLLTIDEEKRNEIRQKWLTLNYEVGVDYSLVKKAAIATATVIVFILFWVFFVYRKDQLLQQAFAEKNSANKAYQLANTQLTEANLKLKEMDQLKSMFIASMSHELRTPLNSIIGFTGIILQGMTGPLNEKQQDHLGRVYNSAKHLLALITDVIDISKIEAGRIDVFAEDINFTDIVNEAIISIEPQLKAKNLELKVNIPSDLTLHTDRKRLLQCLINYLSNAVKFTEIGSVSISAETDGASLKILVTDTGIGISGEDQPKLFEAFERLESHLRVKAGGTGLGLYLTRKLAREVLGGDILVESQEGKGSTFGLIIPMKLDLPDNQEEHAEEVNP